MVNIVVKELQMVFLTSTVINSNENTKELERKIKCEKLMFRSRGGTRLWLGRGCAARTSGP